MLKKNILSVVIALIILWLSLADSDSFSRFNITSFNNIDKLVHLSMYFGLMLALIFENRKILGSLRSYAVLGTIPFFYGIMMEVLQFVFTSDRHADIADVFFNLCGVILAVFFWKFVHMLSGRRTK